MTTKITEKNISNVANFAVDWQTVVTADGSTNTTAVAGKGYFIDTTSAAHTIVLPASPSFGDTIIINDYASTFATNNVTINPNGNKIEASTTNGILSTNDQTHTLVYTDSTQGWKIVNQDTTSDIQPQYISATGGTITTSGDFKIHTFTGDGCFVVSSLGSSLIPAAARDTVDYLVVAGGGGGGYDQGGAGGAGGFRESKDSTLSSPHTASPLAATTGLTITATTYPVTVGGGGAGRTSGPTSTGAARGSNSVFSTITSAGGGGGNGLNSGGTSPTGPGGSGAGGGGANNGCAGSVGTGGTGNTPPTSPSQGNSGGNGKAGVGPGGAGGGGGATSGGATAPSNTQGGTGGTGGTTSISGSPTTYSGGGGGASASPNAGGLGGPGGGGQGGSASPSNPVAQDGTTNTGGGGGGGQLNGASGGKGIVIIRYKFQ